MSGSSTEVDRAELESRDREQLVAIATALGRKPPSRARKAEIIDLIVELATDTSDGHDAPAAAPESKSATSPAGGEASRAAAAEKTTNGAPADNAPAESAPAASAPQAPAAATRSNGAQGSSANNGSADGQTGERNQRTSQDRAERGANKAQGGGRDNGNDPAPAAGTDPDKASSSSDADPGTSHADGGSANDDSGAEGGGGRRRRRRGRDRGPNQGGDQPFEGEPIEVSGILDLRDDGYGFLRLHGYLPHRDDSYVSVKQVRQFGLRKGDHLKGQSRPPSRSEKNPALLRIEEVNGVEPVLARDRPKFEELTPLFPEEHLRLEHPDTIVDMTPRIIDLLAPIGKGQRGLIVAPPKSGKTAIMKAIARAIEQNHPEVHLMVLLLDERPEEVTDFQRWVRDGEVAASTFDRPTEEHAVTAELAIERAKRIVEAGGDVVMLVDGITRLARAYNLTVNPSGRIMSGGIDAAALYPPKRFFGAARNIEGGGSLTILATALVETNSRMDEHIFEEFKGTGNLELRLDRRLAERRIFPAIDVAGSSTRHEELLFSKAQVAQVWKLRKVLAGVAAGDGGSNAAAMELLIERMQAFKSNEDFLAEIAKTAG